MMSMILFKEMDQIIVGAETVKDLFGYTAQECIGNNFSMLLTATYRELTAQIVWECLVNKKPMLIEGQHKDETRFAISLLITEAQQEMNGSAVLIATIFQLHLEYAFITVNKLGTIIAVNSRAEKLFEKSYAELSEKNIKTILPTLEEGTFGRGFQKQVIGNGGNAKQLSLWVGLETDSLGISELYNLKIEDLTPDMEMEIVLQLDETMTITDCSRYFVYSLTGYLNRELIGESIHNLIDPKDIDNKVNLPDNSSNDNGSNSRKRAKTVKMSQVSFVASPSRIMLRNKSGFLTPFNMHISQFNTKTERFSIYLKPSQSGLFKPPDEVIRNFADYAIQLQVDNGECGSSTTVFSAINKKTSEQRAIKIINKKLIDANQKQRAINEYNIAKALNHVNIIKYLDQFETENYLCTVMEFGKDGSLETFTRKKTKLSEEDTHKYFSQFVSALNHCHQQNVCHGDIKLNNVVLCDGIVKLIDFNMSKRGDEKEIETTLKRTTFCGTSLYLAPEMVLNKDYDGQKADIWSLGVSLFVMITGEYPFDSIAASLQNRISIPSFVTPLCSDLIKGILTFDPVKRLSCEQILDHQWIKNFNNPVTSDFSITTNGMANTSTNSATSNGVTSNGDTTATTIQTPTIATNTMMNPSTSSNTTITTTTNTSCSTTETASSNVNSVVETVFPPTVV